MIDVAGRARLAENQRNKDLVSGLKDGIVEGLKSSMAGKQDDATERVEFIIKRQEEQKLIDEVKKLGSGIALVINVLKSLRIDFPKFYRVQGHVDVDSMPPVKIVNLKELGEYFNTLNGHVAQLAHAISMVKPEAPIVQVPKTEINLKSIEDELIKLQEIMSKQKMPKFEFPASISVDNFPPQLTPQPVTHFSINALRGNIKTTDINVTTSATALPNSNLTNRRALIVYNNSSNTIYIGGSDVTTSNGLPVPASSYSPILDAGYNMTVYAIAGSTSDVRVLEASDEASGR